MKKLPDDDVKLRLLAQKFGVSLHGIFNTEKGLTNIPELQSRIINAQRSLRESRLWWIALFSAIASILSALASWTAVLIK